MQTAVAQSEKPGQWTDPSPHEIRFVTVAPGVQLEVLDWGGSGDPLVFLAGLSMNAHAFDDFAARFTDTHRVVGITRRGHGESSWPDEGYSLGHLVEDIQVVLDTLGVGRAIFAGHSYAGSELTQLAVVDPDRVAGLIYIDAIQDLTQIPDVMQAGCPAGREFEEAAVRTFQNPEAFLRTQRRTNADNTSRPNASAAAMEQIVSNVVPPDYANVKAPALAVSYVPERIEDIFFGVADPSQTCVSAAQRLTYGGIAAFAESMQRGTVVALQNSQHNLHLASPDELEKTMRWWLADLPEEPVAVTVNSESATVDTTHSDTVEKEARQFMAGYAKDLLSHDPDAIAGRYSRRGTYVVFPGDWNLQPHDSIASMYRERWQGPEAFEWHDLSYEVIGEDAVAVIGGFRFETDENSGVLGTYTALLVREDGELRIRLENESFDNLPPQECEAQEEPCDLPLDRTAMERYIGEYKVTGQEASARVYEENDSLMIHSPGFPPTRLLYQGDDEFRMAEFPGIRLLFNVNGEHATSYIVFSGMVLGNGKRVTAINVIDE
jgi:pimeloyl-ACP methyl ester carboxylesterase